MYNSRELEEKERERKEVEAALQGSDAARVMESRLETLSWSVSSYIGCVGCGLPLRNDYSPRCNLRFEAERVYILFLLLFIPINNTQLLKFRIIS